MQPGTTTTTEIWQWHCATCRADWKMLRQVTIATYCPHGGRCCQGTPPPPRATGNHPRHCHHLEEGTSRALAGAEGTISNAAPARQVIATLNPAPPAVAEACWVPDPYLMVQQLREFESLNDELVALRVQLQEYAEEIDKSKKDSAGMYWLLALPANVRDVLIMARDVIESFIAISTAAPVN